MIEKHILTLIALLLIIFLVLAYAINSAGSGGNFIAEPGETHPAVTGSEAVNIPADTQASAGIATPERVNEENTVPASELEEQARNGWELIWNDEFNGKVINDKYWSLQTGEDIWGNNELQYYTDRAGNCCIKDGKLIITGLREQCGNSSYTSARITTKDKLGFLYGKIEIKARFPKGKGLLSAIWFLPCEETYNYRLKNGEFDLAEMLGNNPEEIFGVAHYYINGHKKSYKKYSGVTADFSESFHVYSVEWDSKSIMWFVDGNEYFTFNFDDAFGGDYDPFNKRFYLIINLAVGGDWPGDDLGHTAFPSSLEIEYVRYYLPAKQT